ncbi:major facilitator superfamily domain-containing protein [Lipomyces oligophaga]|uniref:major facilitator superfamily domain-containing protein n=1 Tax=Lipomyces oligophaga TaxID=45792 RepID=UPI0034D01C6A
MQSYLQYRSIKSCVDRHCTHISHSDASVDKPEKYILSCARRLEREPTDEPVNFKENDVYLVGWDGPDDPLNPKNFSFAKKIRTTLLVSLIAFVVTAASATDAPVLKQAAKDLHVSEVAESLATGSFLLGYAVGAVFAAPFSEALGRNLVYIVTLFLFGLFVMASALAPNFGAQVVLRFIAGFFGSTPLVCSGGSIADLWNQMEKTYAFPLYSITCFGGPIVGPVITSFIGVSHLTSWRWAEWMNVFMTILAWLIVFFFMPETFGPLLLKWKAAEIRKQTGQDHFKAEIEVSHRSLKARLKVAFTRPFLMALEPIIILMALYLTVLYIALFTFLNGYSFIFGDTYGLGQGLTNICFLGLEIGMLLAAFLVYPIWRITKRDLEKAHSEGRRSIDPEVRLWFGMLGGSISIPIGLFWMGWTDYASVSIWSPLVASVVLGYGIVCIFTSVYMYVIDSYEIYAASALTLVTFMRYTVAGGMTEVGIPFYKNMGTHWTLTIMACLTVLLAPLPYALYIWGKKIRSFSKYAVGDI